MRALRLLPRPADRPPARRAPAQRRVRRDGELLPPDSGKVDVARMAIGQDKLLVTPLQMAMVAATDRQRRRADGAAHRRPHRRPRRAHDAKDHRDARRPASCRRQTAEQARRDDVAASSRRARAPRPRSRASTSPARPAPPRSAASNQPWFIAFAPAREPARRDRGDRRALRAAPAARSRRRSPRQVMRGAAADDRADRHRRRSIDEPLPAAARGSASGGMAEVWCAEDHQLGRQVALKLLYRRFAEDPEFVERFRREASRRRGPAAPATSSAVYDRGECDGTYYIAMEFLEGRSLKEVVQEEAPLDPVRAIDLDRRRSSRRPASPTSAGSSTATSSPTT